MRLDLFISNSWWQRDWKGSFGILFCCSLFSLAWNCCCLDEDTTLRVHPSSVQGLKMILGINQQAGRFLRYKETNEHPNELVDRFSLEAPFMRTPPPGDCCVASWCTEDLLCHGQIHARAAEADITQVCCSELLVGDSLLCSSGSPIQSLNSLHTGSTFGHLSPASSLVQMLATEGKHTYLAFPFSV